MPDNCHDSVRAETRYADPVRGEIRVYVPWPITSGSEVRGRLMGPRCAFASTVEVAYSLRPTEVPGQLQVVIPEPSLWEPDCPFLYEGPIELWRNELLEHRAWVSHALRKLVLRPSGLFLNGKPIRLHGTSIERPGEGDLLLLRQKGYNAVVTSSADEELRRLAARIGFLLVEREDDVCRLGDFAGLALEEMPSRRLPDEVAFLLVPGGLAKELRPLKLPMILWKDFEPDAEPEDILGWIERHP